MNQRDYGLFLPTETAYSPEDYERAVGGLAEQQATYESQMDQFYTDLGAKLGMFAEELGWEKEKFGKEFGFEESKWKDLFGLEEDKLGFEEGKWKDTFGLEQEKLALEEDKWGKGLDWEKERFEMEQKQAARHETLPYLWAEEQEYEKELKDFRSLQDKMEGAHNLGWLISSKQPPTKPNTYGIEDFYSEVWD